MDVSDTPGDARKQAVRLAKYAVDAEDFLAEGLWAYKFMPMIASLLQWHQGGLAPNYSLRQEFWALMSSLDARISEKKQQHTVEHALICMQNNVTVTKECIRLSQGK